MDLLKWFVAFYGFMLFINNNSTEVIFIIHKISQDECMAEDIYKRQVKGKN